MKEVMNASDKQLFIHHCENILGLWLVWIDKIKTLLSQPKLALNAVNTIFAL